MNSPLLSSSQPVPGTHTANDGQYTTGSTLRFDPATAAERLLVVGSHGQGRVTAFTSDAAPHWVGGLVDWGDQRLTACADGANPIEVGNWYARLFVQMVAWTARI